MSDAIRNLIVISDTHCGCRLGLHPPDPSPLDDGGTYHPSTFQAGLWAYWREFWDVWAPEVCRGEGFDLVVNGDAVEGTHHRATTPISHNIQDQLNIACRVLAPIVNRCRESGGQYYHVRGTEAHVGTSGVYEEQLAQRLGAVPNEDGQHARYELWKRVGGARGPLVHCNHHIGTTGSSAHEASAVNAELSAFYADCARWEKDPPDYIVRSHRHRSIAVEIDSARGYAACIVTPGWQGRGPFPFKIPGGRIAEPQVGGLVIRMGDEEHYWRRKVWSFKRGKVEA